MCSDPSQVDHLDRAIAGDEAALRLLLAGAHESVAHRVAVRIPAALRRVVDLEDVLQDAFVLVIRALPRFDRRGPGAFERWVCTIALNRLRNILKAHRTLRRGGNHATPRSNARRDESTVALLDLVSGSSWTASRFAARAEAEQAVRDALAGLPARYGRAIGAVYMEGRAVADVAAEIGCSERAVHGLCRRGLRMLRDALHSASRF